MKRPIHIVSPSEIQHMRGDNLQKMLYTNFIELATSPRLGHNMQEINRLVHSPDAQIYFYMIDGRIAGYLVGEIMNLNDGRKVFYITYLYTSDKFRKRGIATELIRFAEGRGAKMDLDGIMLTCDTGNQYVYDYYQLRGFMPDMQLRNYSQHEVLFKMIPQHYF